jgi:hypothetical protein
MTPRYRHVLREKVRALSLVTRNRQIDESDRGQIRRRM